MLTSLLPGVRELRAPLAAGYLLFLAFWISLGDRLPSPEDATGFIGRVYELAEAIGRPGVAAALTFAAYLVGVVSNAATRALLRAAANRLTPLRNPSDETVWSSWLKAPVPAPLSDQGTNSLRSAVVDRVLDRLVDEAVRTELHEHGRRDWVMATMPEVPDHIRREVVAERVTDQELRRLATDLSLLPTRLLGTQPELYGSYDRLQAEAEFRAAVSIPLVAALLALSLAHTSWWLAGLPFALLLFYQGATQLQSAGDVLAVALRARREGIDSPVLAEVVDRHLVKTDDVGFLMLERAAPFVAPLFLRDQVRGSHNPESLLEAERWFRLATEAAEGDPSNPELAPAMYELSLLLRDENPARAEEWLRKAAEAGVWEAQDDLVLKLLELNQLAEAEVWIQRIEAASRASLWITPRPSNMQYELGARYERQGDLKRAAELYRRIVSGEDHPYLGIVRPSVGFRLFPNALFDIAHDRADRGEPGGAMPLDIAAEAGWSISQKDGRWTAERGGTWVESSQ